MTDKSKLLEQFAILCDRFPDWRFGQLVSNVAGWTDIDVWDVEDDQLQAAIQNYLSDSERKEAISLEPHPAALV